MSQKTIYLLNKFILVFAVGVIIYLCAFLRVDNIDYIIKQASVPEVIALCAEYLIERFQTQTTGRIFIKTTK